VNAGLHASPVQDRSYFKSVYFREPGGVLLELATDEPGFSVDEPVEKLGTTLALPERLEEYRSQIQRALEELSLPRGNR
jgi:glyoxalase family protein